MPAWSTFSTSSESEPGTPVDYADLRDMKAFPIFTDCPDWKVLLTNGKLCRPQIHWCLLVEVVAIERPTYLVFRAKDKADNVINIVFNTEGLVHSFEPSQVREGDTVAITYPIKNHFVVEPWEGHRRSWGVRREDYHAIKRFPISLNNLLRLSDEIQSWPQGFGEHTKCHGCGKSNVALRTCAGCNIVKYCSKNCQNVGWERKNHRQTCQIIADSDFQKMMTTDWVQFRGFKKFLFCES